MGWENFGGSEAGGIEVADAAGSAKEDDTNLGSQTHKLLFFFLGGYLPLPPVCRVELHILALGEPAGCPLHPSHLKGAGQWGM